MSFNEIVEFVKMLPKMAKYVILFLVLLFFISIFSLFSEPYSTLIKLLISSSFIQSFNFIPLLSYKFSISSFLLIVMFALATFICIPYLKIGFSVVFKANIIKKWGIKYKELCDIIKESDINKLRSWCEDMKNDLFFISKFPEFVQWAALSDKALLENYKSLLELLGRAIKSMEG